MNLTGLPVIDNHCHPSDPRKANLEPLALAREFYHGLGDVPGSGAGREKWTCSPGLLDHIANLGVVQTLICQLAKLFDCLPELAAVARERNRRTAGGLEPYARLLYEDAGIVGTVVDSDLRPADPALQLTPGGILRLFQMGPALDACLALSHSYAELLRTYQEALENAVRTDGYAGVKAHLAEVAGFGSAPAPEEEAEAAFTAARAGDSQAYKRLYVAVFVATMLQCQELHIPVHVHCGCTGGLWDGSLFDGDPYLLVPLIRQPRFRATTLVLLHAAYPWIQKASAMAHIFPNVWVDIGWVTPWTAQRAIECFRELLAVAPLSKLMVGSGGHGTPEIAWLAAKVAKIALGEVLDNNVRLGLLATAQAEHAARMILHDNAARLYRLM